jgi:hypothetical protein
MLGNVKCGIESHLSGSDLDGTENTKLLVVACTIAGDLKSGLHDIDGMARGMKI